VRGAVKRLVTDVNAGNVTPRTAAATAVPANRENGFGGAPGEGRKAPEPSQGWTWREEEE